MYFILRWILNALVLMLIPYLVSGIEVASFFTAMITALALGLVNAVIKPVLIILTLPINILTLGLFTLVINGLLFWFVSSFIKGFSISGFWPAFWAALIYSLVSIILNYFLDKKNKTS